MISDTEFRERYIEFRLERRYWDRQMSLYVYNKALMNGYTPWMDFNLFSRMIGGNLASVLPMVDTLLNLTFLQKYEPKEERFINILLVQQ